MDNSSKFFFGECEFKIGATTLSHIQPASLPEVAFCGSSNVGKSSLINSLTNRKTLCRTSNTPGRTRQINFFTLREQLSLVDLPGYGYAKVSKKEIKGWNNLILDYLKGRVNLTRVFLLIDSRRNIKETDLQIMQLLDEMAVNYQIILTKSDKVKSSEVDSKIESIKKAMKNHPALYPEIIVTSSTKKSGIDTLRETIYSLL